MEASVVYNDAAAIKSIDRELPDIVLLDIGMLEMSGLTVAGKLKAAYDERCPILIAVTAWSDPVTKIACYCRHGVALNKTGFNGDAMWRT